MVKYIDKGERGEASNAALETLHMGWFTLGRFTGSLLPPKRPIGWILKTGEDMFKAETTLRIT